MIYRLDELTENKLNPITKCEYDSSWSILMLTDGEDYQQMCGGSNGCAYTIKVSRSKYKDWKMAVCDFIGFSEASGKNGILVMTKAELEAAKSYYDGHEADWNKAGRSTGFLRLHNVWRWYYWRNCC